MGSLEKERWRRKRIRPEPKKNTRALLLGGENFKLLEGLVFWGEGTPSDAVGVGQRSPVRPERGRAGRRVSGRLWSSVEPRGKEEKGEGRAKR